MPIATAPPVSDSNCPARSRKNKAHPTNYLAARHYRRFAWAGSAQAELSPRTKQVLAAVTNEVRVTLYFDPEHPLFKMSQTLLKAYATANPRIVIETIDYTRDNSAALAAKRKYNLNDKNDRDLVIFDCQGRPKVIYQSELSDLDLNELMAGRAGETFAAISILTDCDQDVLQIKVTAEGHGAACHTGRRSCFYRKIVKGELEFIDNEKLFDPEFVYGK